MSQSLPTPVSQAVGLSTLAAGSKLGPLTWSGSAWSGQTVTNCEFNGGIGATTVTATGIAGRIKMILTDGGTPAALTMPMSVTVTNSSVTTGDVVLISINHESTGGTAVWGILRSVNGGSFVVQLLSSTTNPFNGNGDLYIYYYVLKA